MRILKLHSLLKIGNSYVFDSPQPANLSYAWNFGSLLAFCLVIQIISGVTLAMHYNPSVIEAFNSVEHIMRDVNNGWFIRYLHANTASAFFFLVYLHIGRGLYYGSYKAPRTLTWTIGTVMLVLMMAIGFLGYVLPYGQMSLWGATVITNLLSAIPWLGQDIVEFVWGGFSVNNATLNRFFALHFVLPFVLTALALMHLIVLHDRAGSGNPLGISGNYDRIPFAPYYIFKDLITIFLFIFILSWFVFFMPNVLGDSENYVMANPMQTPPAIVPEWYLLPFYAILRSIPNKLIGVIAMFSSILIILILPLTDLSRSRGIQFRPLSKIAFYIFVVNFLILMQLGAKHVESPFIEFGQISTAIYFLYFILVVPCVTLFENTLIDIDIHCFQLERLYMSQSYLLNRSGKTDSFLLFLLNEEWKSQGKPLVKVRKNIILILLLIFLVVMLYTLCVFLTKPLQPLGLELYLLFKISYILPEYFLQVCGFIVWVINMHINFIEGVINLHIDFIEWVINLHINFIQNWKYIFHRLEELYFSPVDLIDNCNSYRHGYNYSGDTCDFDSKDRNFKFSGKNVRFVSTDNSSNMDPTNSSNIDPDTETDTDGKKHSPQIRRRAGTDSLRNQSFRDTSYLDGKEQLRRIHRQAGNDSLRDEFLSGESNRENVKAYKGLVKQINLDQHQKSELDNLHKKHVMKRVECEELLSKERGEMKARHNRERLNYSDLSNKIKQDILDEQNKAFTTYNKKVLQRLNLEKQLDIAEFKYNKYKTDEYLRNLTNISDKLNNKITEIQTLCTKYGFIDPSDKLPKKDFTR